MQIVIIFVILISRLHLCLGHELSKNEIDNLSIHIAHLLHEELNKYSPYYDMDLVANTMKEIDSKKQKAIGAQECYAVLEKAWEKIIAEQCQKNLQAAEQFFENLEKNPRIIAMEKGKLYYEILKPGTGEIVTEGSSPVLYFKQTNIAGEVIRDFTKRAPLKLTLSETIKGFCQGVTGMRVGEKRKIYVHPDFAYGKLDEEPNQLLIFEVEIFNSR